MRYIHLNNDSYIVYLSTGFRTVTRTSFNFNKIKKLIRDGADEDQIIPFLQIPALPNGIYEAYTVTRDEENSLIYLHTENDGSQEIRDLVTGRISSYEAHELITLDHINFVGVYASLEDLMEDWPEYLL